MGVFPNNDKFDNGQKQDDRKRLDEVFFGCMEEKRKTDPLIGAKLGSQDIWNTIFTMIKEDDDRFNVNAALLWASGLAGYACQASVWDKYIVGKKMPVHSVFMVVGTTSGKNFYMGELLNKPLLEDKYSIWSLSAGMYHRLEPSQPLPDISPLVKKVVEMLGKEDLGKNDPYLMLEQYSTAWKSLKYKICRYCKDSDEWSLLFGLILQKAIEMAAKVIPAKDCIEIAMENALLIAKLDISKDMV